MPATATMPESQLFLAAANPALANTGDLDWDARFAEWLIADGLCRSDAAFGDTAKASEAHCLAGIMLADRYGKNFHANPVAGAMHDTSRNAVSATGNASTEKYYRHLWDVSAALAMTPAPNLATALFKIELIKREELDYDTKMTRDAMEVVIEDMERLRQRSAP